MIITENQNAKKKMEQVFIFGILGCILMGSSDWLMIYGDTSYRGNLAWLTTGTAQIAPWRNSLAMFLAFPAVAFYSFALFGIKYYIHTSSHRKIYSALTSIGLTPWLCLHLFYIMILYLFAWLSGNGYEQAALAAGEALFQHFAWLVPVGQLIMLLPYCYLFYLFISGKSVFSRWMALNNPLIIYAVLKMITIFMSDSPFRLAFTNGLMSESMAIWFLALLIANKSLKTD